MKKVICLLTILLFVISGCTKDNQVKQTNDKSFSYSEDYELYKDETGVKLSGFVNNTETEVKSSEDAVECAKNECTVDYDQINVSFDSDAKIYMVSFSKDGVVGGNQDIYVNQKGITQLIVNGE